MVFVSSLAPQSWGDGIVALGAVVLALLAIGTLGRHLLRFFRGTAALVEIANYELRNNGGGSLKDKVERSAEDSARAADLAAKANANTETLTELFRELSKRHEEENRALWMTLGSLANSATPLSPTTATTPAVAVHVTDPNTVQVDSATG